MDHIKEGGDGGRELTPPPKKNKIRFYFFYSNQAYEQIYIYIIDVRTIPLTRLTCQGVSMRVRWALLRNPPMVTGPERTTPPPPTLSLPRDLHNNS